MTETNYITADSVAAFKAYLISEEKSEYTVAKYMRDVAFFADFLSGDCLTKERTLEFKRRLMDCGRYADGSINSVLSSVRSFLKFIGRNDCDVKNIRVQEMPFNPEERCLTKEEFKRLLDAAESDQRLRLILLVFFATGIRVSELKYFTVESFRTKLDSVRVTVRCKKKNRRVLVSDGLKRGILKYIKENGIKSGPVFCTKSGRPLDRSNIWKQMKRLCAKAKVAPSKVFPHNLRKLFARTFYEATHDIVQLSCILGHSSINTTKIYVKTTEKEVRARVEQVLSLKFFEKIKKPHYPHNVVKI